MIKQHQSAKLVEIPVRTAAALTYEQADRLKPYRMVVPGEHYTIYVVHGYTNSHTDLEQRANTVGDIPALEGLLAAGRMIDVAQLGTEEERAKVKGGTCLANGAKERTRRGEYLLYQRMASRATRTWVNQTYTCWPWLL